MEERVSNFEKYIIFSEGKLWSDSAHRFIGSKDKDGYTKVSLYNDKGEERCALIHVLVAEAFLPKPQTDEKLEVDHIIPIKNGGTDDVSNLRWLTHKDNCNNEKSVENYKNARTGKNHTEETKKKISDSAYKKTVYQYSLDGKLVKVWSSACEAGRNGYSSQHISSCCNNKRKSHKGYRWSYFPL